MPSKVASKSSLSPSSASPSSNRIDLGKNDISGGRSQVSASSGGIGITQEITSIGGMQISGGVSVDISPLEFEVSSNGRDTVSIAGSAEIPGGLLGVGGGISIDTSTGQIKGGSISGEVAGLGIEISQIDGSLGLGISLQIPFTPISINLGIGQEKKEKNPPPSGAAEWSPWQPTGRGWETTNLNPQKSVGKNSAGLPNPPQMPELISFPQGEPCGYNLCLNYDFLDNNTGEIWLADSAKSDRVVIKNQTGDVPPRGYSFGSPIYERVSYLEQNWVVCYFLAAFSDGSTSRFNVGSWKEDSENLEVIYRTLSYENIYLCTNLKVPSPNPPLGFPLPPNQSPRKQMDECCRTSIKLLREIHKGLGIRKFPGQLPATIIQEISEEGAQPAEPPQVPIADWVDLFMWNFKRDDERWGQWEIQINVKDSDITQEGDQSKPVKFPNLAESIAEIEGQILSLTVNMDALVAITTKNLVESGLARQEAIKGYLASKAIIKYMAFKTTEIDVNMPACFTPGAEAIDKLVDESTIHFKGIDYTDRETLRDVFLDLLQAAAIIRAVHWERIDTKKDIKGQILERLTGIASLANSVRNPAPPDGTGQAKPTDNFEDFCDKSEDGFRTEAGITDAQNPYGRTPDRRPRIRQIGDNISQAGTNN